MQPAEAAAQPIERRRLSNLNRASSRLNSIVIPVHRSLTLNVVNFRKGRCKFLSERAKPAVVSITSVLLGGILSLQYDFSQLVSTPVRLDSPCSSGDAHIESCNLSLFFEHRVNPKFARRKYISASILAGLVIPSARDDSVPT